MLLVVIHPQFLLHDSPGDLHALLHLLKTTSTGFRKKVIYI